MTKGRFKEIEETLLKLAGLYYAQADAACDARDTSAVHWFVTEARKAGNMPRMLRARFGDNG